MPSLLPFLVVMVTAQGVMAACFNAAGVLAPVIAPALGYSLTALGPYAATLGLSALAGGMLIDGLMRRYGGARTFQIAMALTVVGIVLGATGIVPLVAVSSVVIGFANGMMIPCAVHLVSRVTPPHRAGIVFAINQCGVPAGFGLAAVIFPLLLRVTGWQMSLVLLAALQSAFIAALQPMRDALDSDRNPAARLAGRAFTEPVRLVLKSPQLRLLGWLAFAFVTVQMALLSYLVSYVKVGLGFSHIAAGTALLVSQGVAVCARLFFGWLLDRIGRHMLVLAMLGIGSGTAALGLAMAQSGWPYAGVIAISAFCGFFIMGWNAVYFAAAAKAAPEGRIGTAVGGTQIFTAAGSAVGPLVFATALGVTGSYADGFAVSALFPLLMGLRLLWMGQRGLGKPAPQGF